MGAFLTVFGILGMVFGALLFFVGLGATDFQLGMGVMITLLGVICIGLGKVVSLLAACSFNPQTDGKAS